MLTERLPHGDGTGMRRPLAYLLAGGLLASLCVRGIFYLLLMTIHPPAALQPGSSLSIKAWIEEYSNWSNAHLSYEEAYDLSLAAALAFVLAFGVFLAPRLAFAASFSLLNVFFAWTSHVIGDISISADAALRQVIFAQADFLWTTGGFAFFIPNVIIIADLDVLVMLAVLIASTLLLTGSRGVRKAVLTALQVAALSLVILGVEIAVFDNAEFNLHVTQTQTMLNFAPTFTNGDLLYSALALFAVCTFLLNFRKLRPQY